MSETMPQWIAVADGLPNVGQAVVTLNRLGVADTQTFGRRDAGWWPGRITHWFALPPLPGRIGAAVVVRATAERGEG